MRTATVFGNQRRGLRPVPIRNQKSVNVGPADSQSRCCRFDLLPPNVRNGRQRPDYRTVRRRLKDFDARKVTAARHGGKRAREMYGAALPQQRLGDLLSFVEIDHSPVDVIVVDEQTRLPLGRPWLSLAVDVPSRMVAGFYLSFDDPSTLSVPWS